MGTIKLYDGGAGSIYNNEDFNNSYSFILYNMLGLGLETGSVTHQHNAYFDFFTSDTAGSTSGMNYGGGSYELDTGTKICTITTPTIITSGSVTTSIIRWDTSGSATSVGSKLEMSLDNGTNFTEINFKSLGSVVPATGSLVFKLTYERTTGSEDRKILGFGCYYG